MMNPVSAVGKERRTWRAKYSDETRSLSPLSIGVRASAVRFRTRGSQVWCSLRCSTLASIWELNRRLFGTIKSVQHVVTWRGWISDTTFSRRITRGSDILNKACQLTELIVCEFLFITQSGGRQYGQTIGLALPHKKYSWFTWISPYQHTTLLTGNTCGYKILSVLK